MGDEPAVDRDHYVYRYLDHRRRTVYVGYGESPERAMSHSGGSHNEDLRNWLMQRRFELLIAGPYRDRDEGLAVEAALISALDPQFNKFPGTGPKFRPIGVPATLAERPSDTPLTEAELGTQTGGALLVYITPGTVMKDGRPKFDPTNPDDSIVVKDIEAWWAIDRHIDTWRRDPQGGPQVLVGVYGNVRHRFVIGACRIATARWGADREANTKGRLWKVPLVEPLDLDAEQLRGRRLEGVRFARGAHFTYHWVDSAGVVRHPATKKPTG